MKEDKFYPFRGGFIKVSAIWQMSELKAYIGEGYNEKLVGCINQKEYIEPVMVSQYKPEYRMQMLEENYSFYREYNALYKAFLEYNHLD